MSDSSIIGIRGKKAVLVGINGYDDSTITDLNYCVNDVVGFYDLLIDPERGGYNLENIKLLIDGGEGLERPIRSNILSSIQSLSNSATTEDSILFYFSGHGLEKEGENYLASKDSRYNVLKDTAISISWIKEVLGRSEARVKIVILDACHAGALLGKSDSGYMSKSFHESIFPAPEGFAILSSCKINEVSHDWVEKEHGVFSYYFLEGLKGSADVNGDNIITISESNKYSSENVKDWAFSNSIEQNPTLECRISGDIPILNAPVSEIIKIMPDVDKTVIKKINLKQDKMSVMTKVDISRTRDLINAEKIFSLQITKIIPILVRYYQLKDIIYISDVEYKYPDGVIKVYTYYDNEDDSLASKLEFHLDISFEYNKENWKIIDSIIDELDDFKDPYWTSLSYEINTAINTTNLIKKADELNIKIKNIKVKPPQRITILTKGWGCKESITAFEQLNGGSKISITSSNPGVFNEGFYDSIKPENIIKFLEELK